MRKKQKLLTENIECAVNTCTTNRDNRKEEVRFYIFPMHDPLLLSQWVAATGIVCTEDAPPQMICSRHFSNADFNDLQTRTLKTHAVPRMYVQWKETEKQKKREGAIVEQNVCDEDVENETNGGSLNDPLGSANAENEETDVQIVEKAVECIEVDDDSDEETEAEAEYGEANVKIVRNASHHDFDENEDQG